MGDVAYTAELGRPFFEGSSAFRTKDDASDNKVSGAYSHVALEFSATEAAEWESYFLFLQKLLAAGVGAIPCRQTTGADYAAGTLVYITGWDDTNAAFTVSKSDCSDVTKPALFVLDTDLAPNANGMAYAAATVSGIDTSAASSAGDPIYAGTVAEGTWTVTAPTAVGSVVQEVGRVLVVDASVGAAAFYPAAKFVTRCASGLLPANVVKTDQANTLASGYAQRLDGPISLDGGATYRWRVASGMPATRPASLGSAALVDGDMVWEDATRMWWIRQTVSAVGYWVSAQIFPWLFTLAGYGAGAPGNCFLNSQYNSGNMLLVAAAWTAQVTSTNNASNYFKINLQELVAPYADTIANILNSSGFTTAHYGTSAWSGALLVDFGAHECFRLDITTQGSPAGVLYGSITLGLRAIHA